jgi:hypothetical protein
MEYFPRPDGQKLMSEAFLPLSEFLPIVSRKTAAPTTTLNFNFCGWRGGANTIYTCQTTAEGIPSGEIYFAFPKK